MKRLYIVAWIDGDWRRLVEVPQGASLQLMVVLRWNWLVKVKLQWWDKEGDNGRC